jgi:metacaspase-1
MDVEESKLEEDILKASIFANARAIVIGIANYQEVNLLPPNVLDDARDIASTLIAPDLCGFDPKNVCLLLDQNATLARLRLELNNIAESSCPDGTVFIFFSGHGVLLGDPADPMSALCPVDCQSLDIASTTLSEAEFTAILGRISANRIVVFLDACHSGGAARFKSGNNSVEITNGFSEKSIGRLAQGKGRVLIASSRSNETSLVFKGARNSVFTTHLLEALHGQCNTHQDGLIRIFEIFNHVAQKVKLAVPERQHPIFKASDLEDNFPIALDRGGVKSVGALVNIISPSADVAFWKRLEDVLCELFPKGPLDEEIWARAAGDTSRLSLTGTGRAQWFSALRMLRQGGGGVSITKYSLVQAALDDFPHFQELMQILKETKT